jgi:hypothetical protein
LTTHFIDWLLISIKSEVFQLYSWGEHVCEWWTTTILLYLNFGTYWFWIFNHRGQITTEYNTVFSGVRVTRSLVLYVMFCRSLFVLLSFFFLVIVTFLSYIHEENMCVNSVQLLFFSILILVHIGFEFSTISLDNILTVCPFVLFLFGHCVGCLVWFSDSDYPFVIFKVFILICRWF